MTYYREEQRFTQTWVWAMVLGVTLLMWYGAFQQLVLGRPFGDNPAPDSLLAALWVLFGLGLPALFVFCRLETEVRQEGVFIRYVPFHLRFRSWAFDELKNAEPRTYSPLREYGGWGIRWNLRGWAYTVKGDTAVKLTLKSGKHVLIGTQHPNRFMDAIERARASQ